MKFPLRFLRHYSSFILATFALVAGLILYFTNQHTAAHWIVASVALLEVIPLLWGMFKDIRSGSYGIDILAATAIVASVILGQQWAAIVIVIMITGGESLEEFAQHRARSELKSLLEHAPQQAHIIRNRKEIDVKASEVKAGEILLLRPGELVPVDAVITDGTASFDESSLTGESLPVSKQIGDQILSGSINSDGVITAKAKATAAESQYEQIIRLVRSATASRAPFVRLADRYSIPFSVMSFAIAGAAWAISGHALRFLEVIVVATPCPLLLAVPIAFISGMSRSAKHGIIVKNGAALERLAEADTVAFDKTGTLTHGNLEVGEVEVFGDYTKQAIVTLAASLEQSSNHVVGQAILRAARQDKLKLVKPKRVQEIAGLGLRANIKGKDYCIGRIGLLQRFGVELPKRFKTEKQQVTTTYLACEHQLIGTIELKDELRSDSKATVEYLKKTGIKHVMIITGDSQSIATSIAKKLGIDDVHAETLPADKLHIIEGVKDRPVVFVGDGVNDAPVLTVADVGIALGSKGSTAASESADIVILDDSIGYVATAFGIAQRTFNIAQQSILIGIGLSILLMLIFSSGKFSPLLGAIIQEGVDVIVIFNALRAHSGKLRQLTQ